MTPAEHYALAEQWLATAVEVMATTNQKLLDRHAANNGSPSNQRMEARDRCLRQAQVHAALATASPDRFQDVVETLDPEDPA